MGEAVNLIGQFVIIWIVAFALLPVLYLIYGGLGSIVEFIANKISDLIKRRQK